MPFATRPPSCRHSILTFQPVSPFENIIRHEELNSFRTHNESAWYGITKFSDLTQQEFADKFLSNLTPPEDVSPTPKLHMTPLSLDSLPKKWDWRDKHVITNVKNQEACGGCWAYSTVAVMETMHALATSDLRSLSVQEVIDCSYGYLMALFGCKGGNTCSALQWMKTTKIGIVEDKSYPTVNKDEQCLITKNSSYDGVKVRDFTCVRYVDHEADLLQVLATVGPVAVSVDATMWNNYQGGIIQHHCGELPSNNHAVTIIGYDLTGPIPYYIVKNSWGTDFGIDGYIYLEYGKNMCSLAETVSSISVFT